MAKPRPLSAQIAPPADRRAASPSPSSSRSRRLPVGRRPRRREAGADDDDRRLRRRRRRSRSGSSSRRGSRALQMAERVKAVAKIAEQERHQPRAARRAGVPGCHARCRRPVLRPRAADEPRRVPLPGDLRLPARDDVPRSSSREQLDGVLRSWARSTSVRPLEEPDAVRRADDRVDDRAGDGGAARAAARRRGDLQPAARPDAARDRRDAPLRAEHPADEVDHAVAARERQPVQHAHASRAAADADREPGARVDPGGGASRRRSTTSTSSASRTRCTTSSPRARRRSTQYLRRTATGTA